MKRKEKLFMKDILKTGVMLFIGGFAWWFGSQAGNDAYDKYRARRELKEASKVMDEIDTKAGE